VSLSAEQSRAQIPRYKFIAPAPPAGAIRRAGILQRIAINPGVSLVVLQAPAGHGKSTALQQIKAEADAQGHFTGWLTFDAGDNDPQRFLMHFQALISRSAGRALVPEARRDSYNSRHRLDWLLEHLATIGRPVALFLDEFQTLSDATVLSFMRSLCERAPAMLRVYLGTRSLPQIGLPRLVVNNRALVLHGDDLRFSPQEVHQFFSLAVDLGIDQNEIEAIYRRTEGWPAALQLFRLALTSPDVRRSLADGSARPPRELAQYLADNVLALQPRRIQDFLLRTAELTRLHARLCDAVLGCNDSREVLLHLERSGMFLHCVDPQTGWFKYHTLFSSILAEQQRSHLPEAVDSVHRRAARWYMEHRFYEETVHHAAICRDFPLLAQALDQWASSLVAGGHLRTVEYWSERIPFEEIACRVSLAVKCAYALVFLRRLQRAKPLLELLRQLSGTGSVLETTDPNVVLSMAAISDDDIPGAFSVSADVPLNQLDAEGFAAFELGACANLRGYCALAAQEYESAREYLALARVHNDHVAAAFSRGYMIAISGASLLVQGALGAALEKFDEGLRNQPVPDESFASAALLSCYVWALYEANDLQTAETLFEQYHDIIGAATLTDFLTVAYLSNARVHDARGRPAKAEAVLDEAEAIARECGWTRLIETLEWERVRRYLVGGMVDQALAVASAARGYDQLPSHWLAFSSDLEDRQLGEIRLALAASDLDAAGCRIQAELKRQRGRVLRQVKLQLLASLHANQSDQPAAAQRNLETALRLANNGGFVRAVLDEGPGVLQLVRERYQSLLEADPGTPAAQPEREFVETILKASGMDLGRGAGMLTVVSQPLTEREREMLLMLAHGTSNKDIASQLFVSENTVKYHLKNIYSKLSVGSRVQAIGAARRIGIIH
jgi:LuxR family maltose regulon positive regulatory protein